MKEISEIIGEFIRVQDVKSQCITDYFLDYDADKHLLNNYSTYIKAEIENANVNEIVENIIIDNGDVRLQYLMPSKLDKTPIFEVISSKTEDYVKSIKQFPIFKSGNNVSFQVKYVSNMSFLAGNDQELPRLMQHLKCQRFMLPFATIKNHSINYKGVNYESYKMGIIHKTLKSINELGKINLIKANQSEIKDMPLLSCKREKTVILNNIKKCIDFSTCNNKFSSANTIIMGVSLYNDIFKDSNEILVNKYPIEEGICKIGYLHGLNLYVVSDKWFPQNDISVYRHYKTDHNDIGLRYFKYELDDMYHSIFADLHLFGQYPEVAYTTFSVE